MSAIAPYWQMEGRHDGENEPVEVMALSLLKKVAVGEVVGADRQIVRVNSPLTSCRLMGRCNGGTQRTRAEATL
jgi:hypothetical protein